MSVITTKVDVSADAVVAAVRDAYMADTIDTYEFVQAVDDAHAGKADPRWVIEAGNRWLRQQIEARWNEKPGGYIILP